MIVNYKNNSNTKNIKRIKQSVFSLQLKSPVQSGELVAP
jgi:hypothetical protein